MDQQTPTFCANLPFGGPATDPDSATRLQPTPDSAAANAGAHGPQRAVLAAVKWPERSELSVGFLSLGSPWFRTLRDKVEKYAAEWSKYCSLRFRFVEGRTDQITVNFQPHSQAPPRTYNSWLGTDSAHHSQRGVASMNLVFEEQASETELRRVILHEFGHAIGLIHEHARADRPLSWDQNAVYAHYRTITRGQWSDQMIFEQVLDQHRGAIEGRTPFDPDSIMMYPFPRGLARYTDGRDFVTDWNNELSLADKKFIAQMYGVGTEPVDTGGAPVTLPPADLTVGVPVTVSISSGSQRGRYYFTLTERAAVRFKTEGSKATAGQLFGPNSDTTAYLPLTHGADLTNLDASMELESGRWYLEVGFLNLTETGSFPLSVTRV